MQIIKSIILDLNRGKSYGCVEIHQGETGGRYIEAKIQRDGRPFEIPDTFSATINACINGKVIAEDVACEINPKEGDTSIVLIPITKYMSAERGRVEVNLLFSEGEETVIAQTVYIMVIKSAIEYAENIYTDISKVNEVLAETLEGEAVNGVLDEKRLEKIPVILNDYKFEMSEKNIEITEPFYLDDLPESVDIIYQKGYKNGGGGSGSDEVTPKVNAVLEQTVEGGKIGETLDENRLNKLPVILDDYKAKLLEKDVEVAEPFYLDDTPNSVDAVFQKGYNGGYDSGYARGNSENLANISKVNDVLSQVLDGESVEGTLDENRLNKLPDILADSKTSISNKGVEISEPFYLDNISDAVSRIEVNEKMIPQEKTVAPLVSEQDITPDEGYNALSKVTVQKVTADIDENISPENIRQGVSILGVSGSLTEGEPIGSYENGYNQGKTDGYSDGHEAGYTDGHKAGSSEERNAIWDCLQCYGTRTNFSGAFSVDRSNIAQGKGQQVWTNAAFKPKYDIRPTGSAKSMFEVYWGNYGVPEAESREMYLHGDLAEILENLGIVLDFSKVTNAWGIFSGANFTRLGVIDFSSVTYDHREFFLQMVHLETMDLYIPPKKILTGLDNTFLGCKSLRNLTLGGNLLQDADFKSSPLTVESAKSVLTHLENYAGTENEFTYSIYFSPTTWEYLDAEGETASPNGNSWRNYISDLGWTG